MYVQKIIIGFLLILVINTAFAVNYNIETSDGQTINTCIATLYDSGDDTGNYGSNEDQQITFCSTNGSCIKVDFTSFNLEDNYDFVYVYDGANTSSTLLATLTGAVVPADVFSSSSCITIRLVSDASVERSGFVAQISCSSNCYVPPPPPSNDDPCAATSIPINNNCVNQQYSTAGATHTTIADPVCATNYNGQDVWFSVQVPASGRLNIDVSAGTVTSGGIAVYKGSCNNLTMVSCSESSTGMPSGARIRPGNNLAGQMIWIRFWPTGTTSQGSFSICAYNPPANVDVLTNTFTPQYLVEDILVTGCLEASNVEYEGASSAIGYFEGSGTILGFNSGIILSTGNVLNASGDGSEMDPGFVTSNTPVESDLQEMAEENAGTLSVHDVSILEFDFVPSSDTTEFRFIFASNEYPTYNCEVYNDVFAFFVSGPGINGTYADNAVNVALIPGTNEPVCIANIHDNTGDTPWEPCLAINDNLYINNDPNYVSTSDAFLYQGFTVPLTAIMYLQSCETYHIKLAIADGADGALDSGVFLEAGSFSSGEQVVSEHLLVNGAESFTTFEGCENRLIFSRADTFNISQPLEVLTTITGTASTTIDLTNFIPLNYTIPAGVIHDTIYYTAILDGLTEGTETINIALGNGCPCNVEYNSFTININDKDELEGGIFEDEVIVEPNECTTLTSFHNVNENFVDYNWNTSSNNQDISVCPTQTTTYYLTITDMCGGEVYDSAIVYVASPIVPHFDANDICFGNNTSTITYNGTYHDSLTIVWNFDGANIISGSNEGPYVLEWDAIGSYIVSVTVSNIVYTEVYSDTILVKPIPTTNFSIDSLMCTGDTLNVLYTGNATSEAEYYWDFDNAAILSGNSQGPYEVTWYIPGMYNITLDSVVMNSCVSNFPTTLEAYAPAVVKIISIHEDSTLCYGSCDGGAELTVIGGVEPYSYSWSTNQTTTIPEISSLCIGTYSVTVADINACSVQADFIIEQPTQLTYVKAIEPVKCHGDNDGEATLIASAGTPPYSYLWSNGITTNINESLIKGNYYFTIADANDCFVRGVATVPQPANFFVITEDKQVCIGSEATLAAFGFGGTTPYTFYWYNPELGLDSGETITFIPPYENTILNLYAVDAVGCTTSYVNAKAQLYPELSFSVTPSETSFCPGSEIQFDMETAGGSGGPYWCNLLNDNVIFISGQTYIPQGADTILHYVFSLQDYCTTPTAYDTVTLHLYETPPNNFTPDVSSGCQPLTVNFIESSSDEGQTYFWEFEDNNSFSTQKNPNYIYNNDGIFDLTLTVTGTNGCRNIVTKENYITVYKKPIVAFNADPTYTTIIKPQISFENVSSDTYYCLWNFGDEVGVSEQISPVYEYKYPGEYQVGLYVESQFGCHDTAMVIIEIDEHLTFYAPTAFSPDKDGINEVFYISGNGFDANNFQFYIYDRWGEIVYETNKYDFESPETYGWDGRIGGSSLGESGVYTWLVISKKPSGMEFQKTGTVTLIR
ncbi:MAG TPA: hypothetical protein DDX39_08785 [Bacteroidales bacterium]|nr:MAG: hypothetical protein A2W98_11905 [Bacteroidetes bacterium GWF2_33_38]OFY74882.1 MAG: hypothetical protein A2265_09080 [Bacteroidetes bacterium RIFOXYA12_FULL_33_9]HBF88722.1 hypothetical protein [Bacteroidales bacterium]